MPITTGDITIGSFREIFGRIVRQKTDAHVAAVQDNPSDLLERAKSYGTQFANGSWGWASNIWSRSAAQSVVIDSEADLKPEHRQLMLSVLEQVLCVPLIKVDANLGQPGSRAEMRCRLYCDPRFPDIAYRWRQLNFPGNPDAAPDAELFVLPSYLENPNVPGTGDMLRVLRFPGEGYTIVTVSSYQGEVKKGFLSHWIRHVYLAGGTGEHASLKEFKVKRPDGSTRKVVLCCWGLSGSGKSTHGLYIVDANIARTFRQQFGVDMLEFVGDQVLKNDDIVGIFPDQVVSPESGAWTKTEDVSESQIGIYRAAMAPHALHENTEWDENGNVSFAGEILQDHGKLNRNARTVLRMADTGYFDGNVDSTAPLNMAVFISPGYTCDYAWVKIADPDLAAKVLADGRTVGHPAQSRKGVGEQKFETRYCMPFTIGVSNAEHVNRFHDFLLARQGTDDPIEVYQFNTTGRVGAEYEWVVEQVNGSSVRMARAKFETVNGRIRPVGGVGPTIEETELFLHQAARGAVTYEPHPVWGRKVLVPVEVPGLSAERLAQFNPFTYRPVSEMHKLLQSLVEVSKLNLDAQCPGLKPEIYHGMDF